MSGANLLKINPETIAQLSQAASPEATALQERWVNGLLNSASFHAAVHHIRGQVAAKGKFRITDPEDAVAEQWVMAARTATANYLGVKEGSKLLADNRLRVSTAIYQAAPYVWLTEVWKQLEAMRDAIPRHTIGEIKLGSEFAYWTLQDDARAYIYARPDAEPWRFTVGHYLLEEADEGLVYYALANLDGSDEMAVLGGVLRPDSVYPDDYDSGIGLELVGTLLAGLAFIESPYIPKTVRRLNRGARRRLSANHERKELVTFVDLRPVASHLYQGEQSDESLGSRDYACRWVVRGHWREQWYPSLGCHKLKYIPPYIKGPEDKPLKQTVYRVAR